MGRKGSSGMAGSEQAEAKTQRTQLFWKGTWKPVEGLGARPWGMALPRAKGLIVAELTTEATDVLSGSVSGGGSCDMGI